MPEKWAGENMRRILVVLALALGAAGCATPYRPPASPPPPPWVGASGMEAVKPPKVTPGLKHAGDAVMSSELRFVRTGVLAETVETKTAFGGVMILPKGSMAYAANYTLFVGSTYTPLTNAQKLNDPVEWCVVVANGFDGKRPGSQTACIFYETPERSRYMEDFIVGGYAFDPLITIGDASGMAGPTPQIIEQPVDFGVRITREIRVMKVDPKGVRIGVVLSDGTNIRIKEQRLLHWSAAGEASLGPFRFRPASGDPLAVEVTTVGATSGGPKIDL